MSARSVMCIAAAFALVGSGAPAASATRPPSPTVLTRNVYLGADLAPILAAPTPGELVTRVGVAWNQVLATNFEERAAALAREIDTTEPDLIGLQEVVTYHTQTPADGPATRATTPAFDYLAILLDALADRGLSYQPVVSATGYDVELTGLVSTGLMDVRITQRDVILVATDAHAPPVRVTNPKAGQFAARVVAPTPIPGVTVALPWAWASADVTMQGRTFRFVTTHLEPYIPEVRNAQAAELLSGPASTDMPVVIVGDFNSAPGDTAYEAVVAGGFADAWLVERRAEPGHTCCHAADLRNPTSGLTTRIDHVFFRGGFTPDDARVVGARPEERTPSGLWASDHGGVAVTLALD